MSTTRQIDRCGRRAAELITAGDIVLTDQPMADILLVLLAALSAEVRVDVRAVTPGDAMMTPTICLIVAHAAACDGSITCAKTAAACASYAIGQAVPVYALNASGPDPDAPNAAALAPCADEVVLAATSINALITDRGIYRPAMLTRHLSDGDTPLDVIVLQT